MIGDRGHDRVVGGAHHLDDVASRIERAELEAPSLSVVTRIDNPPKPCVAEPDDGVRHRVRWSS